MIELLVEQIAADTRLSPEQARMALAGSLAILRNHGDPAKVDALMQALPGADDLAKEGAAVAGKAGLMGGLLRFAGGAQGAAAADALAMGNYLKKQDVKAADLRQMLPIARKWARKQTGSEVLDEAMMSIPGVAAMMAPKQA